MLCNKRQSKEEEKRKKKDAQKQRETFRLKESDVRK